MTPAIKIENISKQYRLGLVGTGTLSHDLRRWWHAVRGKEDPYLKIGDVNDRIIKGTSEYIWALKNINFEVEQGEVLGIIGKNGAGKSTLLKILSRVTAPTTGLITYIGRIASLLEVGTGFHPELTGRENIYLNGAILGMRKNEIGRKFDEIVDFSGCERYIDTPVKRYSSGMTVRLGFAVAAFLEPEILVVDEVLAVGDAEFQKKAIGKMQDVSRNDGRTVLFVSHNMAAVTNLCKKGILLGNGQICGSGLIEEVVNNYQISYELEINTHDIELIENRSGNRKVFLCDIYLTNKTNTRINSVLTGDDIRLNFVLKTTEPSIKNVDIGFSLHNYIGDRLSVVYSSYSNKVFQFEGKNSFAVSFLTNKVFLQPGKYSIGIRITENGFEADWIKDKVLSFEVIMGDFYGTGNKGISENTKFLLSGQWE